MANTSRQDVPAPRAARCPAHALALTLAIVGSAAAAVEGQANISYPGVYIREVTFTTDSGATIQGSATLLSPAADVGRAGSTVVLEVGGGALQQALARFHRQGVALDGRLHGGDDRGQSFEWTLRDMRVTRHERGRADAVRFVLEPASAAAPGGQGKVEYAWKVEPGASHPAGRNLARAGQPDPDRISPATRQAWIDFWVSLPAARATALERHLRGASARGARGQTNDTDWEFIRRFHPRLPSLSTALHHELGFAEPGDEPAEWRWIWIPVCSLTDDGPRCDLVLVPCNC
jgi:hypothetical protein